MKKTLLKITGLLLGTVGLSAGVPLTGVNWGTLDVSSRSDLVWQQLSPGDGGTSWYLRIHPADAMCMVQSCDMSASYITFDGSRSYQSVNDPDWGFPRMHYLSAVDFCEAFPDTGFAGSESNGIFKTTDRGRTWQRVSTAQIERIFGGKFPRVPISALSVDPEDPNEVWAGIGFPRRLEIRGKRRLPQGLIVSRDGGSNWEHLPSAFPAGEMALRIVMLRQLPGHIFVVTDGGIHVSADNGRSFAPMTAGLPENMTFCDLDGVFDAASGQVILTCTMESVYREENGKLNGYGGVWRCEYPDGQWYEVTGNLRFPAGLFTDLADFKSGLASSPHSLIATKMAFEKFMSRPEVRELYLNTVLDYHRDPAEFHRMWRSIRNSRQISELSAVVREKAEYILPDFHTVRVDPRDPQIIYVSIFNTWVPYGVWKSCDGGKNWVCITRGAQAWQKDSWAAYRPADGPVLNIRQAWTTRHPMNYGTPKLTFGYWDVRKFDLSRSDPDILYFHTHRVTYRSTDGGKNWVDASNAVIDPEHERFRGLGNSNMCVFDLAVNPFDPQKILFWMADCGLKISDDGGRTLLGLPHIMAGSNQWVQAAAFDPDDPERFYAVFNCRDWLVGGLRGQYFIESRNFGKTFLNIHVNRDGSAVMPEKVELFNTNISHLLVDPASPLNNRRFLAAHTLVERYAVVSGSLLAGSQPGVGIIESTDHGRTWHACNTGLGQSQNIVDLVPVPGNFNTLYAAAAKHRLSDAPGGLFTSSDGGRQWHKIDTPLSSVTQVVPLADGRIFIAGGIKEYSNSAVNNGGIFVSEDGGKNWRQLLAAPLIPVRAVNPANPQIIYCAVERGSGEQIRSFGLWRSNDGGRTWERVNSGLAGAYNFTMLKWHPADKSVIFCGTYGSGYYVLRDPDLCQNEGSGI
ncbi:MAG: hypothetical protein IKC94_05230 [Lentisphaeria bacterium]|nr:hypothetical protein [Lentisphaeria bacterium]